MDFNLLRKHIADGMITERSHPTLPLKIYNYTDKCQYSRTWDDVTLQCRGLVMYENAVVARPLKKFFNDTEHKEEEIPWSLPYHVTEKLDGTMLIVFNFQGQWIGATRGSFDSWQAKDGMKILESKYKHVMPVMRNFNTYLFEYIAPEDRKVVDYKGVRDVVLFAVVDTFNGKEVDLKAFQRHFNVVKFLPGNADIRRLREIVKDNEEGYVVRFKNGFRFKSKGDKYIQQHRILCGLSNRSLWDLLSEGKSEEEYLSHLPEEMRDWAKDECRRLREGFAQIESRAAAAVKSISLISGRKEQALKIMSEYRDISSVLFNMLDGKDYRPQIWKMLYPELVKPKF